MRMRAITLVAVAALVLTGCSTEATAPPTSEQPTPSPSFTDTSPEGAVAPVGTPEILATGLKAPWSVVRLSSGSALISERDTGNVLELTADGSIRIAGTVPGVDHGGEGGLLGLAIRADGSATTLYAYLTSATDNRIVRINLRGAPGNYSLGSPDPILTGLKKAGNHNGGRIAIGPDGKLYATVGDAGQPDRAQDMASLNGKILRMNLDGSVPADNPIHGSLIYTLGHRNPQGIAWDSDGQLWASEFGQNTWDELNRIVPGKNYGWPVVEGQGGVAGFADPVHQWPTSEASPSGLAFVGDTFFMAALRGARLWAIYPSITAGGEPDAVASFTGEYGRLRDAVPGPDGSLWILTNNTDGRGSPLHGDDKLLQVSLAPLSEG
ncbi:MAG: PQQ-dependent sugar dehydrogenase [Terrimesophilobacter sp.]